MKIVIISDVHGQWKELVIPPCDLLISAGDYGNPIDYHKWLDKQPAQHIVSVQGNHENWREFVFEELRLLIRDAAPRIHFVATGTLEIEGIKIFCSSGDSSTYNWSRRGGDPAKPQWSIIPDDTEILITHEPPFGILDAAPGGNKNYFGSESLMTRIKELKHLRLHAFGHVHASSGECDVGDVHFVNAAICDEKQKPVNPVRTFILPDRKDILRHYRKLPTGGPIHR